MINLQQIGNFTLARLLLSVPSIFLLIKVSFTYSLLLSTSCFLLLGGVLVYMTSITRNTETGLFEFPGEVGSHFIQGQLLLYHPDNPTIGESIIDAVVDVHHSQVHHFYALEKFYRSQHQEVKKLLLPLGFSLQLKITTMKDMHLLIDITFEKSSFT